MEILYFALYILLIVIIGSVLFKINSAEDYKKNVRKKRLLLLALVIISLVVFFIVERGFPSNFFSFSALFSILIAFISPLIIDFFINKNNFAKSYWKYILAILFFSFFLNFILMFLLTGIKPD